MAMTIRLITIGDICDFQYGDGLREDKRHSGKVPVFGSNGVVGWHNQSLTNGPTIVIGRKGSIGEINWSDGPCFPIDTTYFVDRTKDGSDLRWLYYALLNLDLTRLNKSAAIPGLNRDDAYEQLIGRPSPEAQKRIARVLDQAGHLSRMHRRALEMSDGIPRAVFLEMFGDPVRNSKGFDLLQIGDISTVSPTLGTTRVCTETGHYRCVRVGEIGEGDVKLAGCGRVSLSPMELKRFSAEPGDILLARAIGSETHLGKLSVIRQPPEPLVFDSHVMRLRLDQSRVSPGFLAALLWTPGGRRLFMRSARRTAVQFNINCEQMSELALPIPSMPIQRTFSKIAESASQLRSIHSEALRQAEHLFQTLLHEAFGERAAS
jgi:type I restriction enzyme S subunit